MQQQPQPFNSGVAAILSLFVPGLGQMCQGRTITGLLCLVLIPLGYLAFIVPGLVMHLACIVDAARA